jgi:hypothetical protein
VRTVRRGCLDHLIPLNERHLRAILSEFVHYYNYDRPHRSLGLQPPTPRPQTWHGGITADLSSADSTTSMSEQLEPDRLLPPYTWSESRPEGEEVSPFCGAPT